MLGSSAEEDGQEESKPAGGRMPGLREARAGTMYYHAAITIERDFQIVQGWFCMDKHRMRRPSFDGRAELAYS